MKSSNRALAVFGAVIGILALTALVLVLIKGNSPVELLPEDSPQGVVQRYMIAIDEGDYAAAWGYLAPRPDGEKLAYDAWLRSVMAPSSGSSSYRATLGDTSVSGDSATVEVIVDHLRSQDGIFGDPVDTSRVDFFLQKLDGAWKISDPVYVWWLY
jgi:hypothetical protein